MGLAVIRRWLLRIVAPLDPTLCALIFTLMLLGLGVLYSASGRDLMTVAGQGRSMLIALIGMCLLAHLPPHQLMRLATPAYVFGLLLLVAVAVGGEVSHGARRWLHAGPIRVQPSEFMKLVLPLALAGWFQHREQDLGLRDFAIALLLFVVPVGLIARQPDLGTALLIASSGCYVLFLAGLSWRVLAVCAVGLGASLPVAWSFLHDYQRQRVLTLLDPSQDPLGAGYHIIQSTIAVGSGGVLGKGWLAGTQAHLDFLPERTTDFIFAVFGEEFGLAGELVLLVLLISLVLRGLDIAGQASSIFNRLAAGAISLTLFTYMFVNMGMVAGILPVVGVPLPFVSYGGTSLITLLAGQGILMSIRHHRTLVKR
jgi:rod shape determining protein RodA